MCGFLYIRKLTKLRKLDLASCVRETFPPLPLRKGSRTVPSLNFLDYVLENRVSRRGGSLFLCECTE